MRGLVYSYFTGTPITWARLTMIYNAWNLLFATFESDLRLSLDLNPLHWFRADCDAWRSRLNLGLLLNVGPFEIEAVIELPR